jgi:hypothetical protein
VSPGDQRVEDATCLECGQPLRALSEERCPECGRIFDPDDPGTYLTEEVRSGDLRLFDVFVHPEKGYDAVKRGFSWPGFFFHAVWAFTKQLWLVGVAIFVLSTLFDLAASRSEQTHATVMSIASFVGAIMVGIFGNDWRRAALRRRGYEHRWTIGASSPEDAVEGAAGDLPADMPRGLPAPFGRLLCSLFICTVLAAIMASILERLT